MEHSPSDSKDSSKKNGTNLDRLKKFIHLPRSLSFEESATTNSTPSYSRTSSIRSIDSIATVAILPSDSNELYGAERENDEISSASSSILHGALALDLKEQVKDDKKDKPKRELKRSPRGQTERDKKVYSLESDDLSNLSLGEYLNARRIPESSVMKSSRIKGQNQRGEEHANMAEGDAAVHRRWVQHFETNASSVPSKKEESQGETISAATMERAIATKAFFEAKYNKLFAQLKDGSYAPLEERRKKIRQEEEEKKLEIQKKEAESKELERKKQMEAEKKRLEQERKKPELEEEERQKKFNEEQQRKQLKILLEENERLAKERERSSSLLNKPANQDFKAISPPHNIRRQFTIETAESDDEGTGQRVRNKDKKSIMQKMFRSPVNLYRKKAGNNNENDEEDSIGVANTGRSRSNSLSKVEGMMKPSLDYLSAIDSPPKTRNAHSPPTNRSRNTSQIYEENSKHLQTMRVITSRLEKKIANRSKMVEAIRIRRGAVELLAKGTDKAVSLHSSNCSSEKIYTEGMMSLNREVKDDSDNIKDRLKDSKANARKIAKKIEMIQERVQDCQRFKKSLFAVITTWLFVFFSGLFGKKAPQTENNSENNINSEPKIQRRVRTFSKPAAPKLEASPEIIEETFKMQTGDTHSDNESDHLKAWARPNTRTQLSEADLTIHKKGLANMSEQLKSLLKQDELRKKMQKDRQLLLKESFANSAPDFRSMRQSIDE